jgi:5-methylcytosine-specific restriction endonuclease McrA
MPRRKHGARTGRQIRDEAMPLEEFDPDRRAEIEWLAEQDKKPPKWHYFGVPGESRPLAAITSRAWMEWHWRRGIFPGGSGTSRSLSAKVRQQVIERDGYLCGLCSGEVDPGDVHIDHIIPVVHGGGDELANLQVAHSTCNLRKGARVDAEDSFSAPGPV